MDAKAITQILSLLYSLLTDEQRVAIRRWLANEAEQTVKQAWEDFWAQRLASPEPSSNPDSIAAGHALGNTEGLEQPGPEEGAEYHRGG